MREAEFRSWLNQRRYQGKALTTVNQRVNWCRAVERALPELGFADQDLDAIHAKGNWDTLLSAVAKLRSNWRNNEAAARVIAPQSDNPSGQMANARSSIGLYGRFANGDDPNYDEVPEGTGAAMTDAEIVARFTRKQSFAAWHSGWSQSERDAFLRLARLLHDAGLDWYHVNIDRQVRCGRKKIGAIDATEVFATISNLEPRCWIRKPADRASLGLPEEAVSMAELIDAVEAAPEALLRFAGGAACWPDQVAPDPAQPQAGGSGDATDGEAKPINLILYGPPGTGKTYATAAEAVRLCGEPVPEDRSSLMRQYEALVAERRIVFVTFHQSFSYEDFIEGLRPVVPTAEGEGSTAGFTLQAEPGVFRQIAERAQTARARNGEPTFDLTDRPVYKMSLGEVADSASDFVFKEAMSEGVALLGFNNIDWSDARFQEREEIFEAVRKQFPDQDLTPNKGVVRSPDVFRNQLQVGDVLIAAKGNYKFRAIGVVEGEYEYHPRPDGRYCHRRKVQWLWSDPAGRDIADIYPPKFIQNTIYRLKDADLDRPALAELISGASQDTAAEALSHVLIIDEINRANISKVFGELITLLEPDKRLGMPNALTVRLPYSKREFGVPANLHIIGTMNTADRSIALLDTALRRRFVFREIAPDPSLLPEEVDGVPLRRVLRTINDRIEYLVDREHRIGHAFFIGEGGKDRVTIDETMRDKVIPLLQEYFFEDWGRVAAVLGEPQGRGGGFLDCRKLQDPTGQTGEERESWSVRSAFAPDAYDRLVGKAAPAAPVTAAEDSLEEAAE